MKKTFIFRFILSLAVYLFMTSEINGNINSKKVQVK